MEYISIVYPLRVYRVDSIKQVKIWCRELKE